MVDWVSFLIGVVFGIFFATGFYFVLGAIERRR